VRGADDLPKRPHPASPFGLSHPPHEGEGEAWRRRVLVAARGWLGTPYRHQASVKGEGADCLGLVRGVWREVVGEEPEAPPAYRADWAETGGEETLLHAARRRLVEVPPAMARAGDVLLFRMSGGCPVKHCAILSSDDGPEWKMIHAYWGRAVVESWMGPWWRRRLVAAFRWPVKTGG
jgi:NlpC/P60 family putative phage cell wall peptidase